MLKRITLIFSVTLAIVAGGFPAYCAEQVAGSGQRGGGVAALIELLQSKKVISAEEAAEISRTLGEQGMLKGDAAELMGQLREKWLADGRSDEDFSELFGDIKDADLVIQRLRVMGVLSGEEADRLSDTYHRRYLAGAISEIVGSREEHYLKTVAESAAGEVKRDVQEKVNDGVAQVKKAVGASEWAQRVRLSGDLRLRYEGDYFDQGNFNEFLNPANPSAILNSLNDRNRLRIRARLNVTAKVNDQTEAVIGLATGNTTDPVSTNQTLGDSLNKKNFLIDKAYFAWKPDPTVTLWGGRFPNPWFYTDLVWDPDINFDGLALGWRPRLSETVTGFVTAGAFPLQEMEFAPRDKWLFGGQLGVEYKPREEVTAKVGVGYYDFENTVGQMRAFPEDTTKDWSLPQFIQKGNTMFSVIPNADPTKTKYALAVAYRELNITGSLDLAFWNPVHVVLTGDYVYNLGYDQGEVNARVGYNAPKQVEGYQFGVTVGHPKVQDFGQWQGSIFYKHLEADAVIDAFTDSDFHLGGTNAEGWILAGELGLMKNTTFSLKWLTANQIIGPPFAIDVFQANLNVWF